jgi:hypothetical protein
MEHLLNVPDLQRNWPDEGPCAGVSREHMVSCPWWTRFVACTEIFQRYGKWVCGFCASPEEGPIAY